MSDAESPSLLSPSREDFATSAPKSKRVSKVIGAVVALVGIVGVVFAVLQYYSTPRRSLSASIVAVPFALPRLTVGDSGFAQGISSYYVVHLHNTGSATATQIKAVFPGIAEWCMEISDGGAVCKRQLPQAPASRMGMASPITIPDLPKGESAELRVWSTSPPITTPGSGLRITHFDGEAELDFTPVNEKQKSDTLVLLIIVVVASVVSAVTAFNARNQSRMLVSRFNAMRAEGMKYEAQIEELLEASRLRRAGARPWTDPETGMTYPGGKPDKG